MDWYWIGALILYLIIVIVIMYIFETDVMFTSLMLVGGLTLFAILVYIGAVYLWTSRNPANVIMV